MPQTRFNHLQETEIEAPGEEPTAEDGPPAYAADFFALLPEADWAYPLADENEAHAQASLLSYDPAVLETIHANLLNAGWADNVPPTLDDTGYSANMTSPDGTAYAMLMGSPKSDDGSPVDMTSIVWAKN